MKKVFISYSRADYVDENGQVFDNSQVGAIVNALNATNNINVWIDINAKYSGKYFTSVLAKKILWADKVLFLSSKNSNESEWVSKEILFAHDNNKEILPIRLDETSYNVDFALILTGIDYIEYFKNPKHKITDIIENILGDFQEIGIDNKTPNHLSDCPVSNQKERKGCLSLNVNYKGCALSMTIAMCLFIVFGIFYKVNEEKELVALNQTTQNAIQTELAQKKKEQEEMERKKAEQDTRVQEHMKKLVKTPKPKNTDSLNEIEIPLNPQKEDTITQEYEQTNSNLDIPLIKVIAIGLTSSTGNYDNEGKLFKSHEGEWKIPDELYFFKDKMHDGRLKYFIAEYFNFKLGYGVYYGNIMSGKYWNYIMQTTYPDMSYVFANYTQGQLFINKLNSSAEKDSLPIHFSLPDLRFWNVISKDVEELLDTASFHDNRKEMYEHYQQEVFPFRIIMSEIVH